MNLKVLNTSYEAPSAGFFAITGAITLFLLYFYSPNSNDEG